MFSLMRSLLDRNHFDIGLVTSWRREDIPADISQRLKSYTYQALTRPRVVDVFRQAIVMPGIARRLGADVILNVDPIGTPTGGARRITVVHDIYFKMLPEAFKKRERLFSDMIMRIMVAASHSIVCVSDQTKKDLDHFYPAAAAKSLRIYGDASAGISSDAENGRGNLTDGHILWVGKVTGNKNISCLYEALKILADRGQAMHAIVVGNDVFGHAAAAESQFGGGLGVERLGSVSDETLKRLYNSALCFVNTSTYEGFGMPVIEAQRRGIPVVCSTGGAVAEVAGEGALTFDPTMPSVLAEQLYAIAQSPQLRSDLTARGYENAKRFSWDETALEIERLIELNA